MIGLVLVTHGGLASEFIVAMEHVVGPQERIEAICIGPDDDMEGRREDIAAAIAKVDEGDGVIILTDLFGGTPSNLAISLMLFEHIRDKAQKLDPSGPIGKQAREAAEDLRKRK